MTDYQDGLDDVRFADHLRELTRGTNGDTLTPVHRAALRDAADRIEGLHDEADPWGSWFRRLPFWHQAGLVSLGLVAAVVVAAILTWATGTGATVSIESTPNTSEVCPR